MPTPTIAAPVLPPPGAVPAVGPAAADALAVLDDPVEQRRFTRFRTDGSGQSVADSSLRISGMHCAACAGLIEQAVQRVGGVLEATVSASGERARVQWLPGRSRLSDIVLAIRAAGYDAVPDTALDAREARKLEHRQAVWRLFVAAFCGMQVMMMATPSYVATGNELAPDLRQLLNWGSWLLSLPVMVFAAGPFFSGAWRGLRQRRIGMDVPVALGVLVTFVASTGATFDPAGVFGHEVYFDSLTMFVSFLLGGRLLETRARHRVAQGVDTFTAREVVTQWDQASPFTYGAAVTIQRNGVAWFSGKVNSLQRAAPDASQTHQLEIVGPGWDLANQVYCQTWRAWDGSGDTYDFVGRAFLGYDGTQHITTGTQVENIIQWAITRGALERDLPLLGICGGQQLLNVVLGGTLIQHLPDSVPDGLAHEQPNPRTEAGHEVDVMAGTLLHRTGGADRLAVNSAHHQAVDRVGPGIVVSAIAPDGVIEAVEMRAAHEWIMGVQWHPEWLESPGGDPCTAAGGRAGGHAIFEAFVAECQARMMARMMAR